MIKRYKSEVSTKFLETQRRKCGWVVRVQFPMDRTTQSLPALSFQKLSRSAHTLCSEKQGTSAHSYSFEKRSTDEERTYRAHQGVEDAGGERSTARERLGHVERRLGVIFVVLVQELYVVVVGCLTRMEGDK